MENILNEKNISKKYYFITAAHILKSRKFFGFSVSCMQPDKRFLIIKKHYAGIHSLYVYIFKRRDLYFANHVKNNYLQSVNYVHERALKLWIIIYFLKIDQLESYII